MISFENLQAHYAEYASQPDSWVENMAVTKKSIVKYVLEQSNLQVKREAVKVTVLGASDGRYVPIHKRIFEELLGNKVELTTLDIDIAHLAPQTGLVRHDVTKPFPNAPQDIVFSHELMKFLTPSEQFATISNSHAALSVGGIAMHIMHEPSIKGTKELRAWQNRVNPDKPIAQLKTDNINAKKLVFQSESTVDWLRETTVILIQK